RIFMQVAATLNPAVSPADQLIHQEIGRLARYIEETKSEIFAIGTNEKAEQVITGASQHLDEVIKATETASNTIMDAADAIQNAIGNEKGDKPQAIRDAVNRIYDACNFQDISGQRITKVIRLLQNIEDRISKLNGLFGISAPAN